MELIADKIGKSIKQNVILQDVSLRLSGGKIYGFVGRNGSGKTMLFRALSGLMSVDSGSVSIDGKVLRKDCSVLPSLGIVLENAGLFPNMTGRENLRYLAEFQKKIGPEEVDDAIRRAGLDPEDKRLYKKYSLGMKQRLAIAQAIMEHPDVIMLDEPTNSLDEYGVEEIRQIMTQEKERGAIVLLASHNKEDIRLLADELYRIDQGRVRTESKEAGV